MSRDMRFMIYRSIHSLQCYNPANDNVHTRAPNGIRDELATGNETLRYDEWWCNKFKSCSWSIVLQYDTQFSPQNMVMVTRQSEIHMQGTRQVPAWYMHPPAYPPWWGAFLSHPPFSWPHKVIGGPIKRGARVCDSHTKPCKFLAPSSIHSLCSIQSHSGVVSHKNWSPFRQTWLWWWPDKWQPDHHRISRTSHSVLREANTTMGLPRWFSW